MKEITSIPAFESVPTSSVSNIEFVEIVDELRPDQWADWDVVFSYNGKEYIGSLQAGVHNAEDFHHDVIEYVQEKIIQNNSK
jgi:hypothetical protein